MDEKSVFKWSEARIAEKIGVDRAEITRLRQGGDGMGIDKGTHWDIVQREIRYSDEGVQEVIKKIGMPVSFSSIMAAMAEGSVEELSFSRAFGRNPKLIEAVTQDGRKVRVAVRTSKNFRAGMAPFKATVGRGGIYRLVGACPRARGRW
jgi:hypothetical protein